MNVELVPLAVLMGLATYPWRAVPLLAAGFGRLPARARVYLGLVGPAILASLGAVSAVVQIGDGRRTSLHVGPESVAVLVCVALVASGRSLFIGLIAAAGLMAVLRAAGWITPA